MESNISGGLLLDTILEKYYLSTMYALEFCFGVLGSVVVIFGCLFCIKEWKSVNIYLFNLSLSDLIFLCTLPQMVRSYASNKMANGSYHYCIINRYILHVNLYSGILFLTCISIDRYLILKYPFRTHILLQRRTAVCTSVLIWIVVTLQIIPLLTFQSPNTNGENARYCRDFGSLGKSPKDVLIYSCCLTVTMFILPMVILCYFYFQIVRFLKNRNDVFENSSFRRSQKLVILAATMFLVLYTPYHIMRNIRIASRMSVFSESTMVYLHSVYIITRPLAFSHSVFNPVFYFLVGEQFREELLSKLKSICCRTDPN
ncbi:succinate receptor 1 [Amia ocellicauda]|uniref:succinate receptor 1 n=1 Tax=Amia ocellicauda TaxID=2972642 RepID=UPI0034648521